MGVGGRRGRGAPIAREGEEEDEVEEGEPWADEEERGRSAEGGGACAARGAESWTEPVATRVIGPGTVASPGPKVQSATFVHGSAVAQPRPRKPAEIGESRAEPAPSGARRSVLRGLLGATRRGALGGARRPTDPTRADLVETVRLVVGRTRRNRRSGLPGFAGPAPLVT
jgi:hypothetical protein